MSYVLGCNICSYVLSGVNSLNNNLSYYRSGIDNFCKKNISTYFAIFSQFGNRMKFPFKAKQIFGSDVFKFSFDYLTKKEDRRSQLGKLLEIHVSQEQVNSILTVLNGLFDSEKLNNMQLLTGGRGTSKIFKFDVEGKDYVLRVTDTERPEFFIDVASEMRNMEIIEPLDISPKILYSNIENGIIVMDYIKNIRLTTQIINHEEESDVLYGKLATSLRKLHQGPTLAGELSSVFDDIKRIADSLDKSKLPPESLELIDTIVQIEQVLKKHQTSAPCHKELNGNNVLYDGSKIFFIDWEGSGNCDPFVDLAISSVFFIFDKEKEEAFLKLYFLEAPTQEQKAYLFLMKHVIHTFYFLKSLRRVVGLWKIDLSKDKNNFRNLPTYKEFVLEYFNGCSKVCDLNDFKTLTYVFLEQVILNLNSTDYKKSIEILS